MAPRRFQHRRHIIGRKARHNLAELIRPGIRGWHVNRCKQISDSVMANHTQYHRRRHVQPLRQQQARLDAEHIARAVHKFIERRMIHADRHRYVAHRRNTPPLIYQHPQFIGIHTYIGGL